MKHICRILLLCIMISSLSGCAFTSQEPISKTGFYFDTVISITIYDTKNVELLEQCFSYCEKIENLISRTIETSEISRINNSGGNPVTVSDTTIELLKQGIYYGELTNGAFDITIAPLSSLWDFKNNIGIVPTESAIQNALSHVDYKYITIDRNTVTLKNPNTSIDLGGIAKGYVADQLKKHLQNEGVESALIDLGGNIVTVGSKPDGSNFHIGIKKPFANNEIISTVSIADSSVVTSGSYERYFKLNDKIYHHILNPETGYPIDNELLGVTILSKNPVDGDALSTSCFVMGLDKGLNFVKSLEGVDAIFITNKYQIIDTRK